MHMLKHYAVNLDSLLDIFVILHFEKFICIGTCCATVSSIINASYMEKCFCLVVFIYDFICGLSCIYFKVNSASIQPC